MRWDEARQDYEAAEKNESIVGKDLEHKIKFQLGVTYRRIDGKINNSIDKLKEAIDKDQSGGKKPTYLNNYGLSLFEADRMQEAESQFSQAIAEQIKIKEKNNSPEIDENLSFYFKNRGLAQYHQGEIQKAQDSFEEAIKLHPGNADNYFNLGNVYLSQDPPDFEKAHENFKIAKEKEPGNAKLYHA